MSAAHGRQKAREKEEEDVAEEGGMMGMGTLTLSRTMHQDRRGARLGTARGQGAPKAKPEPAGRATPVVRDAAKQARERLRRRAVARAREIFGPDRMPGIVGRLDPPVPFAVGIAEAAARRYPEADRAAVAAWFACVACTTTYRRAVAAEGAMRHDLDGRPLGPVTEADRAHAARVLRARRGEASHDAGEGQGTGDDEGEESCHEDCDGGRAGGAGDGRVAYVGR